MSVHRLTDAWLCHRRSCLVGCYTIDNLSFTAAKIHVFRQICKFVYNLLGQPSRYNCFPFRRSKSSDSSLRLSNFCCRFCIFL